MYAYKQSTQTQYEQITPKTSVTRIIRPAKTKKRVKVVKKTNFFLDFLRRLATIITLSAFGIFVLPTSFNGMVKQPVMPDCIPLTTTYANNMNSNPAMDTSVNLYTLTNPLARYISNDLFNNVSLLTPTKQKEHNEVTTMYHAGEIELLKNQLESLIKKYPTIQPSIYVWEYDHGGYVDINADRMTPAASIIKIPVLVRMFKSIEANQFTIYDEMKMIEEYRSSGSGNLQYQPANKSYTIDYLAKTMIQDSDNTSTNMIMSKMGGMEDVNIGLRDWGLSKTYVRTWLPDLGGTNMTTASDIAKLLYNLDNPGFLNINSRESIIDYMSHVKNDRLIQAGLGAGALFIHKTGDIGTMLGDAGIVFAQNGKKYIVVILVKRPYNSPLGKEFIVKASSVIYKHIVN